MKQQIKKALAGLGYELSPIAAREAQAIADLDAADRAIVQRVAPYTLTGLERRASLIGAVDHLVRHRRVAPDRLHAEAQVGQVVPGRDHDGEARPGGRKGGRADLDARGRRLERAVPARHRSRRLACPGAGTDWACPVGRDPSVVDR